MRVLELAVLNSLLWCAGSWCHDRAQAVIYRFAGHVARLRKYDPGRITAEALHWKNRFWLDIVEQENNGAQLHCRRLKVWRWEQQLIRSFGRDWEEQAQDKDVWETKLSSRVSS